MTRPLNAFTTIDRPFDAVARVVARDPASAFATPLDADQRTALVELDADVSGVTVKRHIVMEIGEPTPRGSYELIVPVSWRAAEHAAAFPTASAALELWAQSTHPPRTQVSIVGTYDPPLGPLGEAVDHVAAGHLVADSITRFVDRVAERLVAAIDRDALSHTA